MGPKLTLVVQSMFISSKNLSGLLLGKVTVRCSYQTWLPRVRVQYIWYEKGWSQNLVPSSTYVVFRSFGNLKSLVSVTIVLVLNPKMIGFFWRLGSQVSSCLHNYAFECSNSYLRRWQYGLDYDFYYAWRMYCVLQH